MKIDDHIDQHPKLAQAGPLALALQVAALAYSNRQLTDGFIPAAIARTLLDFQITDGEGREWVLGATSGAQGIDITASFVIGLLLDAGIWEPSGSGYQIHDYGRYQPSAKEVLSERDSRHEQKVRAGRKGAEARWGKQDDSSGIAEPKQEDGPVPDPVPVPQRSRSKSTPSRAEPSAGIPGMHSIGDVLGAPPPDDPLEPPKPAPGLSALEDELVAGLKRFDPVWEKLSFGAVNKLNKRFGRPVVVAALQRCREERSRPAAPFPWLQSVCKAIAEQQQEAAG